ncbi:TRAP transporter small permease subunit [Brucella anthropi]|uniref:TRAP transporter small permease subunit n=1 Tax=Brucella anthropi TaxID=529 RepID=UPI00244CA9BC|nr:TRAP transporter small permease subunit [Brucella anthropi]MDG9793548.1 TRAP transporter small permease [Brucella anthropi]MDH0583385.1 TRAP transporter small permease [Brucella anthropi]MDH0819948.1 TRAP transporter small permease [Brucella anthropi]MDH2086773.1 TRAP transporter small permease [Brucella anthropi]
MPQHILAVLHRLNRLVAIIIGMMLMACVAFVLTDIMLRRLGVSLGGTDEITGYVMAIASAWGMGFVLLELAHVRIDVVRSRLTRFWRSLLDLFSMLVLSSTITVIAFRCWPVVETTLRNSARANTSLETPLWFVQLPWLAGWIWFAIMAWATFLAALVLVIKGAHADAERVIGVVTELEMAL